MTPRRRWIALAAFVAICTVIILLAAASSASALTTTALGRHPSIEAQPAIGRGIDDMAVHDGRLYLGSGDYTANTGPIDVAYFDLATGEPGVAATAPTEEVNTYRTYGGHLFAPWVDPTGWGGAVNGGMTSDVGGWHNEFTFPAGHVYDYAELGTSRFLCGAIAYGGAGVWQSDDAGPWRLVREEESPGGATGWERFYWCVTLGNRVYMQAKHKGGTEAMPDGATFGMWSYDGARWRKVRATVDVTAGHQVEEFKGRAYFRGGVFDGNRVVRNDAPVTFARDWFDAGDWLYVVGNDGTVARTPNGAAWDVLGRVDLPAGEAAYSVAADGADVYVGTSLGNVYRLS